MDHNNCYLVLKFFKYIIYHDIHGFFFCLSYSNKKSSNILTGSIFSGLGNFNKIVSFTSFSGINFCEFSLAYSAISAGRDHLYSSSSETILNIFDVHRHHSHDLMGYSEVFSQRFPHYFR